MEEERTMSPFLKLSRKRFKALRTNHRRCLHPRPLPNQKKTQVLLGFKERGSSPPQGLPSVPGDDAQLIAGEGQVRAMQSIISNRMARMQTTTEEHARPPPTLFDSLTFLYLTFPVPGNVSFLKLPKG